MVDIRKIERQPFSISSATQPFSSPRINAQLLAATLEGCDSILDVGCGALSPLRMIPCRHLVGVDGYAPAIESASTHGTHDELRLLQDKELDAHFQADSFDACAALDVIEHLTRKDGLQFLGQLERIARRRVVIVTPSGFLEQKNTEDGDLQEHLSGWEPDEMRKLGYHVTGINGWRPLRTDHHRLRFKPAVFWGGISTLTHYLWCTRHPQHAAAMLCVKTLD